MKKMTKLKKVIALGIVAILALALFACDTASVKQTIIFNEDFSGSRIIELEMSATPTTDSSNENTNVTYPGLKGAPYYRIRKHGTELETYIQNALDTDSYTGDFEWDVEVDDSGITGRNSTYPKLLNGSEKIIITFDFDNFGEYVAQMRALASFGGAELSEYIPDGNGNVDIEYEDPKLTINLDDNSVRYFEKGSNSRFLYKGLWTHMVDDPAMFTDGKCYDADGDQFTVEKGSGRNDVIKDGIKIKSLSLTANGSTKSLKALLQTDGLTDGIPGHTYYDVDMVLTATATWQNFFVAPVTVSGNTLTYTGDNAAFRWFAADANGAQTGAALTTNKAYTHTFNAGDTDKKFVGVDGSAFYIKTLTAPTVQMWTVTFKDWDGTVLGTVQVEDGEDVPQASFPQDPGMRDDGKVFKNWSGTTTNITADTEITAVYGDEEDDTVPSGCNGTTFPTGGIIGGMLILSGAYLLSTKRQRTIMAA